jgi:hypothetical protein
MCPLRRVEDNRAGSAALGILVPPGRRTFLILRPRSLSWDLLLLRTTWEVGTGIVRPAFREMSRNEATAVAQDLFRALEEWSAGGSGRIDTVRTPDGAGSWLRACLGAFSLLACPRCPGQPYQPLVLKDADAQAAKEEIAKVLCPPPGVEQEVYCNTRNFSS